MSIICTDQRRTGAQIASWHIELPNILNHSKLYSTPVKGGCWIQINASAATWVSFKSDNTLVFKICFIDFANRVKLQTKGDSELICLISCRFTNGTNTYGTFSTLSNIISAIEPSTRTIWYDPAGNCWLRSIAIIKCKYCVCIFGWAKHRKLLDGKLSDSTMFADRNEADVTILADERLEENYTAKKVTCEMLPSLLE